MPQVDHTNHKTKASFSDTLIKRFNSNKPLGILMVLAVAILLILIIANLGSKGDSSRTETYKKATGGAGLEATISYDCGKSCKHAYDFNVYIFRDDGQQTNVVRPDKHGKVNLALQEGNYVMLIGKQFGKDKLFPQEKVTLKNGKSLELKLNYKE